MPKDFTDCVNAGGRVVTLPLSKDRYIHVCYLNGKSYAGEVKTKEKQGNTDNVNGRHQ